MLTELPLQRNLPKGARPGMLLLGMGAVMGYGWYRLIHGVREAKYVPTAEAYPNHSHHDVYDTQLSWTGFLRPNTMLT